MYLKRNRNILLLFILLAVIIPCNSGAQQPTAKTFLDIGKTNLENAEYSEAVGEFKHAIKLKPSYAEAHYYLGNAYFGLHRYEEALGAYKSAVKADPGYAEAHFSVGLLSSMLGMENDAIDSLNKAIRHDPKLLKAYLTLGDLYSEFERHEDAASLLKKAVRIKPKSAEARYKLGIAYIELSKKNMALARRELRFLRKLDKDYAKELQDALSGKK